MWSSMEPHSEPHNCSGSRIPPGHTSHQLTPPTDPLVTQTMPLPHFIEPGSSPSGQVGPTKCGRVSLSGRYVEQWRSYDILQLLMCTEPSRADALAIYSYPILVLTAVGLELKSRLKTLSYCVWYCKGMLGSSVPHFSAFSS